MKIRTITCFHDPGGRNASRNLQTLASLSTTLTTAFEDAGMEVQSRRLAVTPLADLIPSCCGDSAVMLVKNLEKEASGLGFRYLAIGPASPQEPDSYRVIPELLAETENSFFTAALTDDNRVVLPAVRASAEIITAAAKVSADGFANLRFAALANVGPHVPFFPGAYQVARSQPAFAVAVESADLALTAFRGASSLAEARERLVTAVEGYAEKIQKLAEIASKESGVEFKGIDFSPAPHPDAACSLGAALEALGVAQLGKHGSLAAAAILADTLDDAHFQRSGYNGLMLAVLEDSLLAQRAAQGQMTLRDLLLYSAVCGTGLDTIPLPGDSSPAQIAAVLADVAALAVRLGKPLTARLMPIPGKQAGDAVEFDFSFFANGRVMALEADGLSGLLAGDEAFRLTPRAARQR